MADRKYSFDWEKNTKGIIEKETKGGGNKETDMTNFLEQSLLKKYVTMIMNSYFKEAIHKDDKWNFRCNVCGDSQKSLRKKRGWILKSKKRNEWIFTCFNCGQTHSLQYWMKKYFPEFHRMFLNEFLQLEMNSEKEVLPIYEKKVEIVKKK